MFWDIITKYLGKEGIYGFSMPDGNTWVGKYNPRHPRKLSEVVIIPTPKLPHNLLELYPYVAKSYNERNGQGEGNPGKNIELRMVDFNPDIAIARWYLGEMRENHLY